MRSTSISEQCSYQIKPKYSGIRIEHLEEGDKKTTARIFLGMVSRRLVNIRIDSQAFNRLAVAWLEDCFLTCPSPGSGMQPECLPLVTAVPRTVLRGLHLNPRRICIVCFEYRPMIVDIPDLSWRKPSQSSTGKLAETGQALAIRSKRQTPFSRRVNCRLLPPQKNPRQNPPNLYLYKCSQWKQVYPSGTDSHVSGCLWFMLRGPAGYNKASWGFDAQGSIDLFLSFN